MAVRVGDVLVHFVTGRVEGGLEQLCTLVDEVVAAGVGCVQLRDKLASGRALLEHARELVHVCRPRGALLLVNDRLDVALAAGADGVHLGVDDLDWDAARRLAPPPFLLGCTAATSQRVRRALAAGADYVGAGPAYGTLTKRDTGPRLGDGDYAALATECAARGGARLPLVAIGGIEPGGAARVIEAGADAVAVSRGLLAGSDPGRAAGELVAEVAEARGRRGR